MTASESWVVVFMLAWPVSTLALVSFALRYVSTPRQRPTMRRLCFAVMAFPGLIWAVVHRLRLGDETTVRLLLAALAYPAFLLLGLVATYRAIIRRARGRQAWAKTERLMEEPVQAPLEVALAA